ncbi:MAG: preprotein translocase subunit SecY, partial [Acidimicrobiales bacterium]
MAARIFNMFRVEDLRNKILFTLAMLVLYRVGTHIPAPGIDIDAIQVLRDRTDETGGALAFLRLFSGGALTQFAIFALGILPYITASIIMQILGVVIPRVEQWQQMGAVGQRRITQTTRYMAIGIALLQSTAFAFLFHNGGGGFGQGGAGHDSGTSLDLLPIFTPGRVGLVVLTLTAGTALLMWMGELITEQGIGNGMSLLIFASVVSSLPNQGALVRTDAGTVGLVGIIFLFILLLVAIVFV